MSPTETILCDGCGQPASPSHIARRLQRLEWSTRFRPVHVSTLLLSAVSPENDADFLYAPADQHRGEAQLLLDAAGILSGGKSFEATLSEFQRSGLFLTHVLECPVESSANPQQLMETRLAHAMTRIRRSLRPKRLALISGQLGGSIAALQAGNLECALLLDAGQPFALEQGTQPAARLAEALRAQNAARLGPS